MPQIILLIITCIVVSDVVAADNRDEVKGLWASPGSIFMVFEEQGRLHGKIIALKDAVYSEAEDLERAGQVRLDDNNPDQGLKTRTILGLEMFNEYEYESNHWQGKIYDPESGKTYQSKIKLADDGRLEIRGYIGIPMFGRTALFEPAISCKPHIVEMLKMTDQSNVCGTP